jgi:hypothetical protein
MATAPGVRVTGGAVEKTSRFRASRTNVHLASADEPPSGWKLPAEGRGHFSCGEEGQLLTAEDPWPSSRGHPTVAKLLTLASSPRGILRTTVQLGAVVVVLLAISFYAVLIICAGVFFSFWAGCIGARDPAPRPDRGRGRWKVVAMGEVSVSGRSGRGRGPATTRCRLASNSASSAPGARAPAWGSVAAGSGSGCRARPVGVTPVLRLRRGGRRCRRCASLGDCVAWRGIISGREREKALTGGSRGEAASLPGAS